jgi:hypothetical protein
MDKSNPPETFGVFKPTGHTVMAFRSDAELQAAAVALSALGFEGEALVAYSPQEMETLARAERQAASALAAFGYELELVDTHLALAESGCSFLIVHAPEKGQLEQVGEVAQRLHAASAQHYGTFMIEDLIGQTAPNAPTPDTPSPVR